MTETAAETRLFKVRARNEDAHHGRVMAELTFEAAAMAYVEHLPLSAGGTAGIGVIVHDVHSGHEHSFWVHFEDGEAVPG